MSELKIKPYPGKGFEPSPEDKGWLPLEVPTELNIETVKLVKDFSEALMQKLLGAQRKYGYQADWMNQELVPDLKQDLADHMAKGDPRDVAAYCAFLWFHNESTVG